MEYIYNLNEFEGPMSLLLELIKKEKMDIFSVNLENIIDTYLNVIKTVQELDIDIASDYLVMASDLLLIKSKKLLPRQEKETEEELAEEKLEKKEITYNKVTVKERIKYIKEELLKRKSINFYEFFLPFQKDIIVASFLAILELASDSFLTIKQEDNFSNIICEVR